MVQTPDQKNPQQEQHSATKGGNIRRLRGEIATKDKAAEDAVERQRREAQTKRIDEELNTFAKKVPNVIKQIEDLTSKIARRKGDRDAHETAIRNLDKQLTLSLGEDLSLISDDIQARKRWFLLRGGYRKLDDTAQKNDCALDVDWATGVFVVNLSASYGVKSIETGGGAPTASADATDQRLLAAAGPSPANPLSMRPPPGRIDGDGNVTY